MSILSEITTHTAILVMLESILRDSCSVLFLNMQIVVKEQCSYELQMSQFALFLYIDMLSYSKRFQIVCF